MKKCLKRGYWVILYFDTSLAKWNHRNNTCWPDVTSLWWMYWMKVVLSLQIPWKVDYLFTAVELKLKKCLKRGYWISVLRFKASTMKVSFNPCWPDVTSLWWMYWMKVVLKSLKSRLSLLSCSTEIEEVPKKWILIFSTSIQGLHNESIVKTFVDPMWLRYDGCIEWKLY